MQKNKIMATDKTLSGTDESRPLVRVGLGSCLAGHGVRYDGGHTQSRLCQVLLSLSQRFTFKTFCPQIADGFATPRPTMRLFDDPKSPELICSDGNSPDLTEQLTKVIENILPAFSSLDGYILMKSSPSCGLKRVKVDQTNGYPQQKRTAGLFAQALKKAYPSMPLEEEGRLHNNRIFDNFVLRVYAHNNIRREVLEQPSLHNLIQFHSSYKYLLMAHDQKKCRDLGRLLANSKKQPINELIGSYPEQFMQTLAKPASRKNHANALLHVLGYLKKSVPPAARQHIVTVIHTYKAGMIPLATPLTLLSHYLTQYGSGYINTQRYLNAYPESINPIRNYCY